MESIKTIRVLIITTVKIGYDGLTNHILSYVKNLDKTNMEIDLVSARGTDKKIIPQLNAAGFHNVYHIECRDTNQLKYFFELVKLIKRNKYHLIHVHGNSATLAVDLLAGVMGGCKVRIAHSHTTSCGHAKFDKCLRPLFNISYTDGFACSEAAGKWLFGNKPFTVIPNGKDIEKYLYNQDKREIFREELGLSPHTIAVCHVAAFVPTKNHSFVVEMFNELCTRSDNFELYLFGIDGVTFEDTMRMINESPAKGKIHFMGTKDNIEDYLQAMDVMVLPSLYEGFPFSLMEGQISGLICLSSDSVPKSVNITNRITYLPINAGVTPWTDELEKWAEHGIERLTDGNYEIFTKGGYNIKENAKELKNKYFRLVDRKI